MTRFSFYPPDRQSLYEAYAAEYRFDQTEPTPWFPLKRELRHSKISLLTTAGIRLKSQPPFPISKETGGHDFRELPLHFRKEEIVFDLATSDLDDARKDINVVAPIDRLIDLAEHRVVSDISERFFSFCGPGFDPEALQQSAQAVGRMLREDEVDALLIFPVTHLCQETAGIIAREIEKAGTSTVTLMLIREVAEQVKIPRSVFVNFPFGHPLGRPHLLPIQGGIVGDMIQALRTLDRPGKIIDLQYRWEEAAR